MPPRLSTCRYCDEMPIPCGSGDEALVFAQVDVERVVAAEFASVRVNDFAMKEKYFPTRGDCAVALVVVRNS